MRRIWLFTSWVLSTALVSWLTFQALSAAQAGVSDPQLAQIVVENPHSTATSDQEGAQNPGASGAPTSPDPGTGVSPVDSFGSEGSQPTRTVDGTGSDVTFPTSTTSVGSTSSPSAGVASTTTTVGQTETGGTASASTTPTTSATAAWTVTTLTSAGGSLTVSYRPGEVRYEAAVPSSGYSLDIDSKESPDIKVTFVGNNDSWEIRARWHDGGFDPEIKTG